MRLFNQFPLIFSPSPCWNAYQEEGSQSLDQSRFDQALAEILFGAVNPFGKLPITMEKHAQDNLASDTFPTDLNATTINYSEGLFVGYRGYEKNHIQPQYPFGYGLSYTTFRYSDLDVDPVVLRQDDQNEGLIRVSFRVTNTEDRAGAETAQLYVAPVNRQ